jgi:hypothetical protein
MKSNLLYDRGVIVRKSLPGGVAITRYAFAINILAVVKGDVNQLQLMNFEASAMNTWFPFFLSKSGHIKADLLSTDDAVHFMAEMEQSYGGRPQLIAEAILAYEQQFPKIKLDLTEDQPSIDNIFIRFSQSSQTWTLYKNIYCLSILSGRNAELLRNFPTNQSFLILSHTAIENAIMHGITGKPIVDNITNLLRDPAFLKKLSQA